MSAPEQDRRGGGLAGEFGHFLRTHKWWWLVPLFLLAVLVAVIVVVASEPDASFLYAPF